jgi:ABC-type glycerol-3-phosphate transport system permease component
VATKKNPFNKKILLMLIIASIWLPLQIILVSLYPASEYSFTLGVALAIFGIVVAITIVLYSKVRKEIPRE